MGRELNIWLHNNPHKTRKEAKLQSDAILQQLLQNALNTSSKVAIHKNSNGKPYVEEPLFFSHSNSKNLHAYVLSPHHELGIDVEFINQQRDVIKLAQRYFSAEEADFLSGFAPAEAQRHFYHLWSKKEAWCKLEGGNLWPYLKQSVMHDHQIISSNQAAIHMYEDELIDGFSCVVASTEPVSKLRINAIG